MELIKTRVLLTIAISSLILGTFTGEATDTSAEAPTPVSSISSSPSSSPASSPSSEIPDSIEKFITIGINSADEGIKQAQNLLEDSSTSSAVSVCLKQCVENFGYAIDDLKKALDDIAANDNYLLSEDLAAASSDVAGCEQCFEEMVGGNNPVAEFDKAVKFTTSHCLSMLDYTS
ncbi:unnamed protein product [Camellia sinensis]|uniref:Pectinesterase inhibitor domain-containing protein n=1 Tax=Camellia sinensis var. sinensis TaxID=542762 RepID=A0A4S4CX28_CAMSN|nr:hypothetical protein TEA_013481 [Camellia sinensis var. sinensis]THG16496.1 hypothetical protein TEA_001677 [Camellia sinensis var. sinensis]